MPESAKDASRIVGSWTHSHEEDSSGRLVFRPSDREYPPARGRESFRLGEGGALRTQGPAADDRPVADSGTWRLDGAHLTLSPEGGSPRHYQLVSVSPDQLVLRDDPGRGG